MDDQRLKEQLQGLFSGLVDPEAEAAPPQSGLDQVELAGPPSPEGDGWGQWVDSALPEPLAAPEPSFVTPHEVYPRPGVNWRLLIWAVLISLALIMLVVYVRAIFVATPGQPLEAERPRFVVPTSLPAPPPASPTARGRTFTILEPTVTPTPIPGGRSLILTPAAKDVGWVVSDDESILPDSGPQNHFGDSFMYAGILNGKVHHAAVQFDLTHIPRGTQIQAASLQLTGLRADKLDADRGGSWRLQLLVPEIDYRWGRHDYRLIHGAGVASTHQPGMSAQELGDGRVNQIEFTSEQLALLERRLLEGSGLVSFRLDGPTEDGDNLFAWDSGYGQFSQGAGPELFLSLGSPPEATPPPHYVVITSTPTPETVLTAMANSLRMTAEAEQSGTATPLPPNWITPVVVTATPPAGNQATAQAMRERATAVAMTTGQPPNLAMATPTATYVVITSTPTPANITTALAISWWATAQAERSGTATPLPPNWVTPIVVTSTPTPENAATLEYHRAVALTTGTPTPLPGNAQTATATPVFALLDGELPTPAPSPTATATPQFLPAELVGKIAFLSDRAYHANAGTRPANGEQALPLGEPLVYVMDPDGSNLALLADRWPYDQALERDELSADQRYRVFVRDDVPWGGGRPTLFSLDLHNYWEEQITHFGAGIAYDPAWSPTSERIVFVSNDSGNDEIWVINRDGSGALQLTRNQWEWDKHPSWSLDGAQIVFWSNRGGSRDIWVMDADGGNLRSLSRTDFNDWNPVWIKYTNPPPALGE